MAAQKKGSGEAFSQSPEREINAKYYLGFTFTTGAVQLPSSARAVFLSVMEGQASAISAFKAL
jgi:hypothetical protein